MAMTVQQACEVLGVMPETDFTTARRAYRVAARATHPDTASPEDQAVAAEEMARVNAAWAVLRVHLRPPVLQAPESEGPGRDPWATEPTDSGPVAREPLRHRARRRSPLVAAGVATLVVVAGIGVVAAVSLSAGADSERYVGACLTAAGDVVECGDDSATVEVTGTSTTVEECEGQVFADGSGTTYFCTTPLDA